MTPKGPPREPGDLAFGPMRLFHDATPWSELRPLYREIWLLAWPTFFAQGLNSFVSFFSRIIVSRLGEQAFNSVNVAMLVFFVVVTIIAAVGVGTTALVAQYWGAGERRKAGEVLRQSLIFGSMLCALIAVVGVPLSRVLYELIGTDPETAAEGERVLFWMVVAVPVLAPGFFFAAALRGAGDAKTPMVVGIVMGVLSLVLSYGFILGRFGFPKLGALGAAAALDGAFFIFSLIMFILFATNNTILKLPARGWRVDWRLGFSILKIGVPSALEWVLIQVGLLVYVAVVYKYGENAVAGYFTGFAILAFAQTPAFGFQQAAITLVGQSVGARNYRKAETAFRHCAMLGFLCMGLVGALIYFLATPENLKLAFPELKPESMDFARTWTTLTMISLPLMGVAFTVAGGLRGAGDTVNPLVASIAGIYGGRIVLSYGLYFGLPILAVWWLSSRPSGLVAAAAGLAFQTRIEIVWLSMFPDLVVRVLVLAARLRTGKWKAGRLGRTHRGPEGLEAAAAAEAGEP